MTTRTRASILYILLIHLFLAVVLWKSNFVEKIEAKLGISGPILSFYERMVVYHKTMDGSIPQGSVLFIGDSITQSLVTSAITSYSVNLGIGSDTTDGVIKRLPLYKSIERAKAVVLAIGINDIHQGVDSSETSINYKNILKNIPSNITVYASSVIPIGVNAERKDFNNTDIISLNEVIENLAKEQSNVVYLDIHNELKNEAGYLREAFHIGDGVHLSTEGYAKLIQILKVTLLTIDK